MKLKTLATWMVALTASSAAFSAVQGEMSDTSSTAVYRNVFGETLLSGRQVQVTMLKDALMDEKSPVLEFQGNAAYHGVRDKFCVIDTTGSNVQIKLNPTDLTVGGWQGRSVKGTYHQYWLTLGKTGGPYTNVDRFGTYDVSGAARTELECGEGNVEKGLHALPTFNLNDSFIDTVILTVTPL